MPRPRGRTTSSEERAAGFARLKCVCTPMHVCKLGTQWAIQEASLGMQPGQVSTTEDDLGQDSGSSIHLGLPSKAENSGEEIMHGKHCTTTGIIFKG